MPDDTLTTYLLATAPVSFSAERLAATLDEAPLWSALDPALNVLRHETPPEGSNNWALAPSQTATGRAIMASDPHRAHAAPSLRYMVHLSAPGLDVIGAGEPSSPGIMAGHNGTAAFSLTIFCADQEDLMVHETLPDAPHNYRYGTGHEEMTRIDEVFTVKGAPDQTLPLYFTRHGPVLWQDEGRNLALSLRTVFTDPGTAPYMASLKSMRATTMSDFREALETWGAPSVNMVYADTTGDICWQAAAYVPRRNGWRGLAPVPGDGRFEWQGYMTAAELPATVNPEDGVVWSANEMNIPDGWNHAAAAVGHEWLEDGRAERISERFAHGHGQRHRRQLRPANRHPFGIFRAPCGTHPGASPGRGARPAWPLERPRRCRQCRRPFGRDVALKPPAARASGPCRPRPRIAQMVRLGLHRHRGAHAGRAPPQPRPRCRSRR